MSSIVELNLITMFKRHMRVRRLTTAGDRALDICSYKSELYGITRLGYAFIMNTVQNKVLFRRRLEGYDGSNYLSLIARSKDTIIIAQNLGTNIAKRTEDQHRLIVFSKSFQLLWTFPFASTCTDKESKQEERQANTVTNLILIANAKARPFALVSLDGSVVLMRLFALATNGRPTEAARMTRERLALPATAIKYCDGFVFFASRDKIIRRMPLLF